MQAVLAVLRDPPGRVASAHRSAGAEIDARDTLRTEGGVQRSIGVESSQHDVGVNERRAARPGRPAAARPAVAPPVPPAPAGEPPVPATPAGEPPVPAAPAKEPPLPAVPLVPAVPVWLGVLSSSQAARNRANAEAATVRRELQIGFRMGLPFLILKTNFMFSLRRPGETVKQK